MDAKLFIKIVHSMIDENKYVGDYENRQPGSIALDGLKDLGQAFKDAVKVVDLLEIDEVKVKDQ